MSPIAISSSWYGKALANILGGEASGESSAVDYLSDTIKVALCTSSYTPNVDTHEFFSDITNEVSGTGYTAGGATLAGKTVNYNSTSNRTYIDANDTSWASSTITARYAIIYKDTGTASTSPLLGYVNFDTDQSSSSGTFQITWSANGILGGTLV